MNVLASLPYFKPELWLLAGAFATLFLDLFLKNKKWLGGLGLIFIAIAAYQASLPAGDYNLFFGMFRLDVWTYAFRYLALLATAITILISLSYRPLKHYTGEYYTLFLIMAFGLTLMAAAKNLLMIYLAIEFVSVLSYLLTGFLKQDGRSKESALKYLLFGSVASGMMLFGMSLLFGASGTLDIDLISTKLADPSFLPLAILASLLVLAGIGFKISMVPFHQWAPDVYEGAPTPVTAFLSVAPKAMGFAVLIRLFLMMSPWFGLRWNHLLTVLSILTMTVGNFSALKQNNVKRLLAFSSIAQAGYILMGLAVATPTGIAAVVVYLMAYVVTNLGAFAAVIAVSNFTASDDINSYRGLAKRAPFLAASLAVFLLSLAGIPPLAGFIGKFYVFAGTIESRFWVLAIVAAINSAVAAYYYFRIVRTMYLDESAESTAVSYSLTLTAALIFLLVATVAIGLAPVPLIDFVKTLLI